ncbi:MAG: succinate dehydrogenase, cytochrome b556 subunit [Pseudomonadota bacterium]
MSDTIPQRAGPNAPLSPHLQVWRFTATMAASITQRIAGFGNAIGLLLFTAWVASAAMSDAAFAVVSGFLASPFGLFLLFGFTVAFSFHLLNGVRYLFWDAGRGFDKAFASKTAWAAYIGSVALTVLIFFVGFSVYGGA